MNDLHPGGSSALHVPTIDAIRANRARLGDRVRTTPVRTLTDDAFTQAVGADTRVWLKEELFQHTGSFKPRGALTVMLDLDTEALARGVTGVSAGNHAISLAYSSRLLGTTARVVMPRTANAYRVQLCRDLGASVELVDTIAEAFARVEAIAREDGRTFVHPYEGPKTALGTATVGLEFMEQVGAHGETLDAVIVAAGGGGLSGGVACAVRQLRPETAVYVVEPEGADTMYRSLASGTPQSLDAVRHDRRFARRAAHRTVFVRAQPALRHRGRARDRRPDPRGDAPALPLGEAGERAGRCRLAGRAHAPAARAPRRPHGGGDRVRRQHRHRHVLRAGGRVVHVRAPLVPSR